MKPRKTASGLPVKLDSRPKRTRQGDSTRSKPNHGRKKSCGQGR